MWSTIRKKTLSMSEQLETPCCVEHVRVGVRKKTTWLTCTHEDREQAARDHQFMDHGYSISTDAILAVRSSSQKVRNAIWLIYETTDSPHTSWQALMTYITPLIQSPFFAVYTHLICVHTGGG